MIQGMVKILNKTYEKILDEPDSQYYGLAEQELKDGKVDEGLWAKAFVKAKGNKKLREVEYIKLRAKQLQEFAEQLIKKLEQFQKIETQLQIENAKEAKLIPESPTQRGLPNCKPPEVNDDNSVKDDLNKVRAALAEYKSK